jgi:hypothetical protein
MKTQAKNIVVAEGGSLPPEALGRDAKQGITDS